MRVNGHAQAYNRVALTPVSTSKISSTSSSSGASVPVGTEAAEVSVSEEARARALASGSAGVNETKVAELKSKIDSGTYAVNTQMLAARLLDTLG